MKTFGSFKFTPSCNGVARINTFIGNVTAQLEMNKNVKLHFTANKLKYSDGKLILQKSESNDNDGPGFKFHLTDTKNATGDFLYLKLSNC